MQSQISDLCWWFLKLYFSFHPYLHFNLSSIFCLFFGIFFNPTIVWHCYLKKCLEQGDISVTKRWKASITGLVTQCSCVLEAPTCWSGWWNGSGQGRSGEAVSCISYLSWSHKFQRCYSFSSIYHSLSSLKVPLFPFRDYLSNLGEKLLESILPRIILMLLLLILYYLLIQKDLQDILLRNNIKTLYFHYL